MDPTGKAKYPASVYAYYREPMGAVMDVAMSISASMFEIHRLNPKLSKKELISSGINVGRDIMGTMANTLILAFLGGAINMIFLF